MIELFGGPATPSVGCAFRFDALVDSFLDGEVWREPKPYQVFLFPESIDAVPAAIRFGEELRARGLRVGVGAGDEAAPTKQGLSSYKTEAIAALRGNPPTNVQWTDDRGVKDLPFEADAVVSAIKDRNS